MPLQGAEGLQILKMELLVCEGLISVSKAFWGSKLASPAQISEAAKETWLSPD